jgi:phosphatidylserine/phosphatidylglycerophosphate/cardiolipin synthase-like enzyme
MKAIVDLNRGLQVEDKVMDCRQRLLMPDAAYSGSYRYVDQPLILEAGSNAWRVSNADRAALLTNADYFRQLAQCLKQARHRIMLLGWQLDADLVLDPHASGAEALRLTDFLATLLEEGPALQMRFLLWDRTVFYGGNHLCAAALGELGGRFDRFKHHFAPAPFACSHHAKVVVIDDSIAFVGGIDLAGDRWDQKDHPPSHPGRVTPAGNDYGPTHDLQMIVSGQAACDLADYAVLRWTGATGEPAPSVGPERAHWPDALSPDFDMVPTAIARTEPTDETIREIQQLNHDLLAAARHCIYLESQYLTASSIGDSLVRQLERSDGPEIVIVVTKTSHGTLEQFAMGNNRDRLLRRLSAADRWGRLRVYYPTVFDGPTQVEVKIHAKLMVIDDRLIRIGSSNLNNRSMAVDTECDLALEAVEPAHRDAIRQLRNRLIAEQLHQPVTEVAAAFRCTRSLIGAIESLNEAGYLQPLLVSPEEGSSEPMTGTMLLDPSAPLTLDRLRCELGLGSPKPAGEFGAGE